MVFYYSPWNFDHGGDSGVHGPFPLVSTCYQWWVDTNSMKYFMKKNLGHGHDLNIRVTMECNDSLCRVGELFFAAFYFARFDLGD